MYYYPYLRGLGESAWGDAIIEAVNQEIELRNVAISEAVAIESQARNEAIQQAVASVKVLREEEDQATYTGFQTKLLALRDTELNAVSVRNALFKNVLVALSL
mgnify:CR=1 FL=1